MSESCLWDWGDVCLMSALGWSDGDMQARLEEDFFYMLWMVVLEFRCRKKNVGVQISLEKKLLTWQFFLLLSGN